MVDVETAERLARLETQHLELVRLMRESHDDMQQLKKDVQALNNSLTKWWGIGAGIVIAVSAIWSIVLGVMKFVSR
jgi:hypothetical protein